MLYLAIIKYIKLIFVENKLYKIFKISFFLLYEYSNNFLFEMNKINKILFVSLLFIKLACSNKFLFSVIISIYNTGRYLDDSIGSI